SAATNFWFEADIIPSRLAAIFFPATREEGWDELGIIKRLNLSFTGASGNVLTRGTLDISTSLDAPLPPWDIPTNFIHSPLTSFTAVRGIGPWLATCPAWQKLQLTPPPDQAYFWSQVQSGGPFVTYFAAPLPAASNQLWQLSGRLVQHANPWLATN